MRRRLWPALALVFVAVSTPRAQDAITSKQRIADLEQLAALYAKNYAPYEWKRDALGFDLLRLTPWLQRIHHADDLDFQEALIEYVASLNDAHDLIAFPTTYGASLGITVDIYDGKVLIDSINRLLLPVAQFPFNVGDELMTVDGTPVHALIASFRKYAIAANQRSTDRIAASRIVSRSQQIMPHTSDLPDDAILAIRNGNTGTTAVFSVPWRKSGIPLDSQGPVPSPRRGNGQIFLPPAPLGLVSPAGDEPAPQIFKAVETAPADNTLPAYMEPIHPLLNASVSKDYFAVLGIGSRAPIYAPPPGFVQRLGTQAAHFFYSGTYISGGVRIGLIRIPSMSPPNVATALTQLDDEIRFFNLNVDALVVDVTRNPGGLVSFVESISQRFIPTSFTTTGFQIRATGAWLFSFAAMLSSARANPTTPPDVLANLENNFNEVRRAFDENRGLSNPVSLNPTGSLTLTSVPHAFTGPADCARRRILGVGRRCVCRDHAGQQPRAAARHADDGRRRQRGQLLGSRLHRERHPGHGVIDAPGPADLHQGPSTCSLHREHRRTSGDRCRLHDASESDDGWSAIRRCVHAGNRAARADGTVDGALRPWTANSHRNPAPGRMCTSILGGGIFFDREDGSNQVAAGGTAVL